MHTLDPKGRGTFNARSQNFLWFAVPLVIYIIDRCMLRPLTTRTTRVLNASVLHDPKVVILNVARPPGWKYQCGQWVKLNFPALKSPLQWHAFSIASSPQDSETLEFIIRVIPGGWTERLHEYIDSLRGTDNELVVKIQGPYGSVLQGAFHLPNAVFITTGTGVVPVLSLMRELRATKAVSVKTDDASGTVTYGTVEAMASSDKGKLVKRLPAHVVRFASHAPGPGETAVAVAAAGPLATAASSVRALQASPAAIASTFSASRQLTLLYWQGTHHPWWCLASLLAGILQFTLVFLDVSFWTNDVATSWPWILSNALTILAMVGALFTNYTNVKMNASALAMVHGSHKTGERALCWSGCTMLLWRYVYVSTNSQPM
jgi:hypothetical protein